MAKELEFLVSGLLAIAAGLFLRPLSARLQKLRQEHQRTQFEDALKFLWDTELRGAAARVEDLAAYLALSVPRAAALLSKMEHRALLQRSTGALALTAEGRRLALQVVRAHRLWERYLADDAQLPLDQLHEQAHRAEHLLSVEEVNELDAHLGYPLTDPHGDPIPQIDGTISDLPAKPLAEWPEGEFARIVHIEDEPAPLFRQILAQGLKPGGVIQVVQKLPGIVVVSDGIAEHRLAPEAVAGISVTASRPPAPPKQLPYRKLSELPDDATAEIVEIDAECRGFSRRRLLDLGFTPGTKIQVELPNPFGDPRGYRLRGTLVALRHDQSAHVLVRQIGDEAALHEVTP